MTLWLHIERLVVDADVAADPAMLEAQVVAALADLLGGAPQPEWWATGARLAAVPATLAPGGFGTTPGGRIGAAIHNSLVRPQPSGGER